MIDFIFLEIKFTELLIFVKIRKISKIISITNTKLRINKMYVYIVNYKYLHKYEIIYLEVL